MNVRVPLLGLLAILACLSGCSRQGAQVDPATDTAGQHYVAVARGRVAVQGGLLTLSAPMAGTLATVAVHEGEQVHQGQILATLDSTAAQAALAMASAKLAMARARAKLLGVQLTAARQLAQRESAAAKAGAGAGQSADTAQASVAQLEAQRAAAHAAIGVAQSRVDEARYALARHTLRTPTNAYVTRVTSQPGASVSASSPLFTLLPQRPLLVRAKLNANYANAVHPGMRAQVSVEGGPPDAFSAAHVLRVGKVFGPNNLNDTPGEVANTRAVDCVLAFDKPPALRVGQLVLVRFLPGKEPDSHKKG